MKACSKCRASKSEACFSADSSKPSGRRNICKTCDAIARRASRRNPNSGNRRWWLTPENYSSHAAKRFWSKVNKLGPQVDRLGSRCWEWVAARNNEGYGRFSFLLGPRETIDVLAHRFSYELKYGRKPKELVLHHCDNRRCVNPDHLYEGTHEQNMRDMIDRDRNSRVVHMRERTHCDKGHEFSDENTSFSARDKRQCLACGRERVARYRARKETQGLP